MPAASPPGIYIVNQKSSPLGSLIVVVDMLLDTPGGVESPR